VTPNLNDGYQGQRLPRVERAYDLGDGWGISGHVGDQKIKGYGDASYTDYKVGATKDLGFGVVGLAVLDHQCKGQLFVPLVGVGDALNPSTASSRVPARRRTLRGWQGPIVPLLSKTF
jgi:hypothetical protein